MAEESPQPQGQSLRDRFGGRGEEVLGRIAQDLLENPVVNSLLSSALEARGRAAQAQEVVMEALNLPSAAQIERLTRRVRSLGQRLEAVEDALMRIEESLRSAPQHAAIQQRLDEIEALLHELREPDAEAAVSRDQERLRVEESH